MTYRFYEPLIGEALVLPVFYEIERVAGELYPDWKLETFEPEPGQIAVRIHSFPELQINLDNLCSRLIAAPTEADEDAQIREFVLSIAKAVGQLGPRPEEFDDLRGSLFLAVRSNELSDRAQTAGEALAFEWPITPDLTVFWGLELGDQYQYVTKKQFTSWGKTSQEVTKIAYENSSKDESEMQVERLEDYGLLITSNGRFETIGHLLYWLPRLTELIDRNAPGLRTKPLLMNVPSWKHVVVVRPNHHQFISHLHERLFQNQSLSREIYVLMGDYLTAKLVGKPSELHAIDLVTWGFGRNDAIKPPYCP